MRQFPLLLASVCIVATTLCSTPASASLVDWGNLNANQSLVYGESYQSLCSPTDRSFEDDYVFTTTATSTMNAVAVALTLFRVLGVDGLEASVSRGKPSERAAEILNGKPILYSQSSVQISHGIPYAVVAALPEAVLEPGKYVLRISGEVAGRLGGSYAGVLNVSQVPLPTSAWLFPIGLLVMIGAHRRSSALRTGVWKSVLPA